MPKVAKPHYGGHLGLTGLLVMLAATGCVAMTEQASVSRFHGLPGLSQTAPVLRPISRPSQTRPKLKPETATFIVRFEDEPLLRDIGRTFRQDEPAAKAIFRQWQSQQPQLEGLELVLASMSGDMLLALPEDDPQQRTPEDVLRALRTMDTLVYAEPDSMVEINQ